VGWWRGGLERERVDIVKNTGGKYKDETN